MRKKKFEDEMKAIKEDLSTHAEANTHAEAKVDKELTDITEDPVIILISEMRDEMKLIREKIEEQIDLIKKIKEEI